jgi:hypothetical protein
MLLVRATQPWECFKEKKRQPLSQFLREPPDRSEHNLNSLIIKSITLLLAIATYTKSIGYQVYSHGF